MKIDSAIPSISLTADASREDGRSMDSSSLASASVRILLVDDFEPWRRSVCRILEKQEHLHIVGEAADGLEAVQKAAELKPDLILLDISLPRLDGIEAAIRIYQAAPGMRIIFLTQHNDADLVQAALDSGARGYVLKTDAGSDILPAIEAILRGDQFLSNRLRG